MVGDFECPKKKFQGWKFCISKKELKNKKRKIEKKSNGWEAKN